jgi:hypothetical protein
MTAGPCRSRSAYTRFGSWLMPGLFVLSACAALPRHGPSAMEVASAKSRATGNFVLIPLDQQVVREINQQRRQPVRKQRGPHG